MLNPEDLTVESFATTSPSIGGGTGACCTGCVSGCGINPTAGGCQSASGDVFCPADPVAY